MAYKDPRNLAKEITKDDAIYFGDSPLWQAATSGDEEYLHKYYKGGGATNQRFNGFGREHSLLLGAARNNNPNIVKILESYGEKPLNDDEADELAEYKYTWNLKNRNNQPKKAPRGFVVNKNGTYTPREYSDEEMKNAYHTTLNHLRQGGKLDDSFYETYPDFNGDAILSAVADYINARGRNPYYNQGFSKKGR